MSVRDCKSFMDHFLLKPEAQKTHNSLIFIIHIIKNINKSL